MANSTILSVKDMRKSLKLALGIHQRLPFLETDAINLIFSVPAADPVIPSSSTLVMSEAPQSRSVLFSEMENLKDPFPLS